MSLSWAADNYEIPVTTYTLYYQQGSDGTQETASPSPVLQTSYTVSSLEGGTSYTFYITATNVLGESLQSLPLTTTTQGSPAFNISQWAAQNPWTLVEICCGSAAGIVVIVILGCMIRKKVSKKREERSNFKENQYGLEEVDTIYRYRADDTENPY